MENNKDKGKGMEKSKEERKEEKMGKKLFERSKEKIKLLVEAASFGDVESLKKLVASEPKEFFLPGGTPQMRNIFNIAAKQKQAHFFTQAMDLLPLETKLALLSQDARGFNPLHHAVYKPANLEIVRSIVGFYKSLAQEPAGPAPESYSKPWLARSTVTKMTPLQLAFHDEYPKVNEDCALEILSLDLDHFCSIPEYGLGWGASLLFCAVEKGLSRLALTILDESSSYSVTGDSRDSTPLHFAPNCSDGGVLELLLKNHPEMLTNVTKLEEENVLHTWAGLRNTFSTDVVDKFPKIKAELFTKMIYKRNSFYKSNALHIAAGNRNNDKTGRVFIECYQDAVAAEAGSTHSTPPWSEKDLHGDTALHVALKSKNEELARYILSLDNTLCHVLNHDGESPLYVAAANGCDDFVNNILENHDPLTMLGRTDGDSVLHHLYKLKEETVRKLLKKYWWMIYFRDHWGETALDRAKWRKTPWLIELLSNPSSLYQKEFDWAEAFKNNVTQVVQICIKNKDTPLHHIKLDSYERYSDLMKIPYIIAELKNLPNSEGDTPLHIALKSEDIYLAQALLSEKEVKRGIKNNKRQTAMKLLQKLHKKSVDWRSMCNQIEVDPFSKTGYITNETNLGEMRSTMSVIAALLATITFAAGFTLPGGLDENTGKGKLAKKAAFLTFLISDTYAMCTSMLVLFLMTWSMVSNRFTSRLLIDRSVFILMQALYGTMVAFMTGIYLIMPHRSLWATIVVIVMCSFTGIAISVFLLHRLLKPILTPTVKRCFKSMEEGNNGS